MKSYFCLKIGGKTYIRVEQDFYRGKIETIPFKRGFIIGNRQVFFIQTIVEAEQ